MFTQTFIPDLPIQYKPLSKRELKSSNKAYLYFIVFCVVFMGLVLYVANSDNPFGLVPSLDKK